MDRYNGFGLALLTASALLAVFTYISMGISPFLAFWIGLLVVGASMTVTPIVEGVKLSPFAVVMILNTLENIGRIVEGLGVKGRAAYRRVGDSVYIVIGDKDADTSKFVTVKKDSITFVFKSPISRDHVSGITDICEAIDYVVVDRLGLTESVDCIDEGATIHVRFNKVKLYYIKSLESSTGTLYSILAASIAALVKNSEIGIEAEECGSGTCVVRLVTGG